MSATSKVTATRLGVFAYEYEHKYKYQCKPEERDPASVQYKVDGIAKAAESKGQKIVCVLGGGASGLLSAKEMHEQGFAVVGFEGQDAFGGVYAHCYEGGQLTTSSYTTTFSDLNLKQKRVNMPIMLMATEYQNYMEDYAEHHNLPDVFSLCTYVSKIENGPKIGSKKRWRIHYSPVHPTNKQSYYVDVDKLIYAAGGNQDSRREPQWKGKSTFTGEIVHSSEVEKFDIFKDQNVVVVGLGESAADMAYMAASVAKQVHITDRSKNGFLITRYYENVDNADKFSYDAVDKGDWVASDSDTVPAHHGIPRHWMTPWNVWLDEIFADGHGGADIDLVSQYNFKKEKLHPFLSYATKSAENLVFAMQHYNLKIIDDMESIEGGTVKTTCGTVIENVDKILLCTGYQRQFPLLEGVLDEDVMSVLNDDCFFKKCMHWDEPDFAVVGMIRPSLGNIPSLAEMQARWLAYTWSGLIPTPSREYLKDTAVKDRALLKEQYCATPTSLVDFLPYLESMGKEIGCLPPINLRTFLFDNDLFWRCIYSPMCCTQYRLRGPGSTPVARELMMAFPLNIYPGHYLKKALWWNIQGAIIHVLTGDERFVCPWQIGDISRTLRKVFVTMVTGTVLGLGYVNRSKISTALPGLSASLVSLKEKF